MNCRKVFVLHHGGDGALKRTGRRTRSAPALPLPRQSPTSDERRAWTAGAIHVTRVGRLARNCSTLRPPARPSTIPPSLSESARTRRPSSDRRRNVASRPRRWSPCSSNDAPYRLSCRDLPTLRERLASGTTPTPRHATPHPPSRCASAVARPSLAHHPPCCRCHDENATPSSRHCACARDHRDSAHAATG